MFSAVVLDFSVSGNLVLGQRKIYSLSEEKRGRMNGIFNGDFFLGWCDWIVCWGITYMPIMDGIQQ